MTDTAGQIQYINARWTEFTGVDGLDMNAIIDAIHPEDLPSVLERMETSRAKGIHGEYETRIKSRNGEYRWHRVKALPMREPDGAIKCWIGTSTDVHDELLSAVALRESEASYRFMVDSNPQVPWIADGEGALIDFSDRWLQMTGLTREKALTDGWSEVPHPDDLPIMMEAFGKAMVEKSALDLEHRARMANGEYRWMRSRAYPRLDGNGNVVRWFGNTEDIHDRKAAQEALKTLNEDLEHRVEERTAELQAANQKLADAYREAEAFSYTASHDLRAPLRAVISTARFLLEDFGKALPQPALDLLEEQSLAAQRMASLIDDLLTHSRIGRSEVRRDSLDLSELARKVALDLAGRNPLVTIEIEPDLKAIGDRQLVPMVLQNLSENSIIYSPDGGTIRLGRNEEAFFVADEGIGFDIQYAERIFQPFERLHRDGDYPGTGIGLANVKKIVALHGGKIWVVSAEGQGATFFFTLST